MVGYSDTEFTWEPEVNLHYNMGNTADRMIQALPQKWTIANCIALTITSS